MITTKTGTFHEHLEYFPYGETWVHEKAAGSPEYMAHLFTGKELDPETGLYDHGARYVIRHSKRPRVGNQNDPTPEIEKTVDQQIEFVNPESLFLPANEFRR